MRKQRYLPWLLVLGWMAVIFGFSAQEAAISQGQSNFFATLLGAATGSTDESLLSFVTRKGAHTFLYLVLGALVYNAVRSYAMRTRWAIAVSIALSLGYAVFDELHQLFVPGRSGEVRDVLIDTFAAGAGILLYVGVEKWRKLRKAAK